MTITFLNAVGEKMRMVQIKLIAVTMLVCVGMPSIAEDFQPLEKAIRDKFIAAENEVERWENSAKLFAVVDDADLHELARDPNDDVAVRAAWEIMLRSAKSRATRDQDDDHKWVRIKDKEVAKFIGFLEGRLRVTPPKVVQQVLESGNIHYRFELSAILESLCNRGDENFVAPRDEEAESKSKVVEEDKEVFVVIGEKRTKIPQRFTEGRLDIAAYSRLVGDKVVVVFAGAFGLGARAICLDRETGKPFWSHDVWVCPGGGASGLPCNHLVAIREKDGVLQIFGLEANVFYIEFRDLNDGKVRFRFSSQL